MNHWVLWWHGIGHFSSWLPPAKQPKNRSMDSLKGILPAKYFWSSWVQITFDLIFPEKFERVAGGQGSQLPFRCFCRFLSLRPSSSAGSGGSTSIWTPSWDSKPRRSWGTQGPWWHGVVEGWRPRKPHLKWEPMMGKNAILNVETTDFHLGYEHLKTVVYQLIQCSLSQLWVLMQHLFG